MKSKPKVGHDPKCRQNCISDEKVLINKKETF